MPSFITHGNVLFSFYEFPCSIHAHLRSLRYLTCSHLLNAAKTSQCAPPNFWILIVHALWAYCTHVSSTSNGLHQFQLQCATRSFCISTCQLSHTLHRSFFLVWFTWQASRAIVHLSKTICTELWHGSYVTVSTQIRNPILPNSI